MESGWYCKEESYRRDVERLLSKPDPSCFFITVGTIATYLTTLAYKAETPLLKAYANLLGPLCPFAKRSRRQSNPGYGDAPDSMRDRTSLEVLLHPSKSCDACYACIITLTVALPHCLRYLERCLYSILEHISFLKALKLPMQLVFCTLSYLFRARWSSSIMVINTGSYVATSVMNYE